MSTPSFTNKDWQYTKNCNTPVFSNGDPDIIEESAGAIHTSNNSSVSSIMHPFPPFITSSIPTIDDFSSFLVQHIDVPQEVLAPSCACPPDILDSVLQQLRSLRAVPFKSLTLNNDENLQSESEITQLLLKFRSVLPAEDQFINLSPSRMPIVNFAVVYGPTAKAEGAQKALNYLKKKQSENETKCYLQVLIVSPEYKILENTNNNSNNNNNSSSSIPDQKPRATSSNQNRSQQSNNPFYGSNKVRCVIPDMPEPSSTFIHIPWETSSSVIANNNNTKQKHDPAFYSLPLIQQQEITKTILQNFCISIGTSAAGWACGRLRSLAETPNATFFATALDEAAFSMLQASTDKTGRLEMRTAKYKADLHLLLGRPIQALQFLNHPQLFDRNSARGPGDFLWICGASDTLCAIRWACLRGVIMTAKRDSEWIFENRRCFIEDQPPEGFEEARSILQDIWGRWSKALRIDQVTGKSQAFPYLADWARGFQWNCMCFDGTVPIFEGTVGGNTTNNSHSNSNHNLGGPFDVVPQDPNNPLTSNLPPRHKRSHSAYLAMMNTNSKHNEQQQQALRNQQALLQKEQCLPAREFDDFLTSLFSEFEEDLKANISTLQEVSSRVIFPGSDKIAAVARLEAEARLIHFLSLRCIVQPTSVYAPRVLLSSCRDFIRKYLGYAQVVARDLSVHFTNHNQLQIATGSSTTTSRQAPPKTATASPSYIACLLIGLEKFKIIRYGLSWMLRRAGLHRSSVEFLREALINSRPQSGLLANQPSDDQQQQQANSSSSIAQVAPAVINSQIHDPILVTELWSELLRWVGLNAASPLLGNGQQQQQQQYKRPGRPFMDTVLPDTENSSPDRLSPITGNITRSFVEQAFAGIVFQSSSASATSSSSSASNNQMNVNKHARTHSRTMSGQSKNFPTNFTARQLAIQTKRQHITAALNTMRIRSATLALLQINDSFFSSEDCVRFFQQFISSAGSSSLSQQNIADSSTTSTLLSLQSQQQSLMMKTSLNSSPNGECGAGLSVTNVEAKPLAPHLCPQPFRFSGYMEGAFKDDFYFSKNSLTGKIAQSGPVIWVVDEVCVMSVELHNSFVFPLQLERVALHCSNANVSSAVNSMMKSRSSSSRNYNNTNLQQQEQEKVLKNMTNNSGIAFDSTFLTIPPQQSIVVDLFFQPVVIGEAQIDGVVWTSSDLCGSGDVEFFAPFPAPLITPVMEELPTATIKIDQDLTVLAPPKYFNDNYQNSPSSPDEDFSETKNGTISGSKKVNIDQTKPTNSSKSPNQLPPVTIFQGQRVEIPILIFNTGTTPIPLCQEKLDRTSKMWYSTMNAAAHEQHCQLRVCSGCASVVQILAPNVMGLRTLDAGEALPTTLVINPKAGWIIPAANALSADNIVTNDQQVSMLQQKPTTSNAVKPHHQHARSISLGNNFNREDFDALVNSLHQPKDATTAAVSSSSLSPPKGGGGGHNYSLSVVSPRAALHRYTQSFSKQQQRANNNNHQSLSKSFSHHHSNQQEQQHAIIAPFFVPPQVTVPVNSRVRLEVFASKEPPFEIAQSSITKLGSCPNVFCHLPARMQRLMLNVNILPSVRALNVTLSASKRLHVSMANDNRDNAVEMKREVEVYSEQGELLDVLKISGDVLCGPGQTQSIIVPVSSSRRQQQLANLMKKQNNNTTNKPTETVHDAFASFSFAANDVENKKPNEEEQDGTNPSSPTEDDLDNTQHQNHHQFTSLSILRDAYSLVFKWQYLQCYEVFKEGKTEVPLASIRHQINDGFSVADLNVGVSIFAAANNTGEQEQQNQHEENLLLLQSIKKWNPKSSDMIVESANGDDDILALDVLGNYKVEVVITAPKEWLQKQKHDDDVFVLRGDESTSFEVEFDVPGGAMIDGCTKGLLEFKNQQILITTSKTTTPTTSKVNRDIVNSESESQTVVLENNNSSIVIPRDLQRTGTLLPLRKPEGTKVFSSSSSSQQTGKKMTKKPVLSPDQLVGDDENSIVQLPDEIRSDGDDDNDENGVVDDDDLPSDVSEEGPADPLEHTMQSTVRETKNTTVQKNVTSNSTNNHDKNDADVDTMNNNSSLAEIQVQDNSFNTLNDSEINVYEQKENNQQPNTKTSTVNNNMYRSATTSKTLLAAKLHLDCLIFAVGTMKMKIHLKTNKDSKTFVVPLLIQASHY